MDNASYHKSTPALVALSLFEHRVLIVWLPTYCSDLNTVECFWRYQKDLACVNKFQDTILKFLRSAGHIMRGQNLPGISLHYRVYKNYT